MAAGGIYDHLAGGFARYSTDRHWLVPHFEKMLTDQALLARAYLHAWQLDRPRRIPPGADRDARLGADGLSDPDGGLWSSVDADAGGTEGAHATFTEDEARARLRRRRARRPGRRDHRLVRHRRGGQLGGHQRLAPPARGAADPPGRDRGGAPHPAGRPSARACSRPIDDKVLTEWNAMAASALAEAAAATGEARWGAAAERIVDLLFDGSRRGRRPLVAQPPGQPGAAPGVRRRLRLGRRRLHVASAN